MFIESEGKCSDCGGPTTSGALQICPKCSARRHQCEHCLAATTAKDETATESKPADPVPDQPHRDDAQDKPAPGWTAPANNANPVKPNETAAAKPADPDSNPLRPIPAEAGKQTAGGVTARSGSPAGAQADQSRQGGHVHGGQVALPDADYRSRHPQRRALGLADLRWPEVAAGRS
jgi:hypothetical protein